jgi:glycosyltransferase involved in cell wall biosynthesis
MSAAPSLADRAPAPHPGRRIRVLHAIQNLNYGGMERLLADIVRHADAERFESHVLALQYLGRFAEGLEDVATLHLAPPMPRWSMLWPGALIDLVKRIAPDVVHMHSGVWFKVSMAAKRAGVPRIIYTEHGRRRPDPLLYRIVDNIASRRTHVVVCVSDALAKHMSESVVADPTRIRVVINGVDTERFHPRPDTGVVRREVGIAPDIPIIGSIGRLEHIKGYDVMVEAMSILRKRADAGELDARSAKARLVLVGEGGERPKLEAMAAAAGLTSADRPWVHFLGWRDDVHDLHSMFELFTMSSRSEGTSVSLLESMSAALCPVVTDVGGNANVLGESLRHRLVPALDAPALATAWIEALGNPARRQADANAARARVQQQFSLDTMVKAYEELYVGG